MDHQALNLASVQASASAGTLWAPLMAGPGMARPLMMAPGMAHTIPFPRINLTQTS